MAAGTAAPPRSPAGEKQAEKFLGRSQLNADAPGLPLPLYGLPLRPSGDTSSPASGTNKVRLSFMLCSIPTSEMGSLQNRKVLFYSRGTNLKDPRIQTPKSSSLRLGFNGIYGIKNKMISGVEKTMVTGVN